jgi:hypothetical protein
MRSCTLEPVERRGHAGVVPFSGAPQGGKLQPATPQNLKDRASAIQIAELLAGKSDGVIVLEQEAEPAAEFYAEPKLELHRGRVPAELLGQLVASCVPR